VAQKSAQLFIPCLLSLANPSLALTRTLNLDLTNPLSPQLISMEEFQFACAAMGTGLQESDVTEVFNLIDCENHPQATFSRNSLPHHHQSSSSSGVEGCLICVSVRLSITTTHHILSQLTAQSLSTAFPEPVSPEQ
jgi:hypothetical protein